MKKWGVFLLWFATGALTLITGNITRFQYGLVWFVLMLYLLIDALEA